MNIVFNWVDLVFLAFLIYFIATNRGFIDTLFEVISLILALLLSYKTYLFIGQLINIHLGIPKGIANAAGFFIAWFIIEALFYYIYSLFIYQRLNFIRFKSLNIYLGSVAAVAQACIIYLFIVSFIFALPVKPALKKVLIESASGQYFVTLSQNLDQQINKVFNEAVQETINFLTIKTGSSETVDLDFKVNEKQISVDKQSEDIMFGLINEERQKLGLRTLVKEDKLTDVARDYAKEMLIKGFFSHISKADSSSPSERATRNNVLFTTLGENLAYAPDVYIAHQGLMNSPGHRANILLPDYKQVGLGVIDAGIYGKMFVQEFMN